MNPDDLTSARNDLLDALEHNDELRDRLTAAEAERDALLTAGKVWQDATVQARAERDEAQAEIVRLREELERCRTTSQ